MDRVRAEQRFNPCPICGKYDDLEITGRDSFYGGKRCGYCLVYLRCDKCDIGLWSHECKSRYYANHLAFLARRWNKLANTKQTRTTKRTLDTAFKSLNDKFKHYLKKISKHQANKGE